jgi:YgiT-type zinc finger domain-containing protein
MTDEVKEAFPCSECQAGVMHLRHITYFTWLDEELVTVPNFPAWVCDMCGRREYDARAISWLSTILNPETGKTSAPKLRPPQPQKKRSATRPSPE